MRRLYSVFDGLTHDVRYGLRQLRRTPAVTAVALLTLALGIGANTALFTLLDAALFKQLPVTRPAQLVSVIVTMPSGGWMSNVPSALFEELRRAPRSFSGVFGFWQGLANVQWGADIERVVVQHVSGDYYTTLGVPPFAGRLIERPDDRADGGEVAVLGHDFWMRRFGGDASIIGRALTVDGTARTIVGITPRWFFGTDRSVAPDVTVPLGNSRGLVNVWITARLAAGITPEQARAETELAWQRAQDVLRPGYARYRKSERDELLSHGVSLMAADKTGGRMGMRSQVDPLRLLLLLSGVVLLIGCANIANLLNARAAARTTEIGTRLALGAGRARIVRQLFVESLLLAAAGGALGVAFAFWAHRVLARFMFGDVVPAGLRFAPDHRVLSFTIAVSAATALLFGLVPAMRAVRVDLVQVMKRNAPLAKLGLGRALVVAQVAACVVLMVAAGLLVRTLGNLRTIDRGFRQDDVILVHVGVPRGAYTGERSAAFYQRLVSEAENVPGVVSASAAATAIYGTASSKSIWVLGRPADERQSGAFNVVGPGFFATTGMKLLLGRDFSVHDRLGTPRVVIVNEAFARRYCPEGAAIGCRFGDRGAESSERYEVVGVVADARHRTLRDPARPTIYEPLLQEDHATPITLHVRARGNAGVLFAHVREALRAVDGSLQIRSGGTLARQVDESLRRDRMMATLSTFFGGLALLLTCVGLFGVVSYGVERRSREIGIRIALGARWAGVLRLVMSGTLHLVAAGALLGLALALVSSRVLDSLLFGLSPTDPATVGGAVLMLLLTAILASYLPARRATALDPMIVLRRE